MISRIVKVLTSLAVVSTAFGGVEGCATEVGPTNPETRIDQGSEIGQIEQGLQLPNCDLGPGTHSGCKPIISAGRDCAGNPLGECRIGDFCMTWDCVRMPDGSVAPQNVHSSTEFCRCYQGFTCC